MRIASSARSPWTAKSALYSKYWAAKSKKARSTSSRVVASSRSCSAIAAVYGPRRRVGPIGCPVA